MVRRDMGRAARAALVWLTNPVSERGVTEAFRMVYSLAGPDIRRALDAMADHEDGARLLADRPDLGRVLSDTESLAALPAGSLGRAYHDLMNSPSAIPGSLLAATAFKGDYLARLGYDDDMLWFVDRFSNTHDLLHLVSGYGTDLAGEILILNFSVGYAAPLPRALAQITPFAWFALAMRPRMGWIRWRRCVDEAVDRGRAANATVPFPRVYWEELLPLPVDQVRRFLGVPDVSHDEDTADWHDYWPMASLARQFSTGFGAAETKASGLGAARRVLQRGVTAREFVCSDESTRQALMRLAASGAQPHALRQLL